MSKTTLVWSKNKKKRSLIFTLKKDTINRKILFKFDTKAINNAETPELVDVTGICEWYSEAALRHAHHACDTEDGHQAGNIDRMLCCNESIVIFIKTYTWHHTNIRKVHA